MTDDDKPTDSECRARSLTRIHEAIRTIKPYYSRHPGGGNLHVVLDDGNMEADSVLWCLKDAEKENDAYAVRLAKLLLDMSVDERYELYDRYNEYAG